MTCLAADRGHPSRARRNAGSWDSRAGAGWWRTAWPAARPARPRPAAAAAAVRLRVLPLISVGSASHRVGLHGHRQGRPVRGRDAAPLGGHGDAVQPLALGQRPVSRPVQALQLDEAYQRSARGRTRRRAGRRAAAGRGWRAGCRRGAGRRRAPGGGQARGRSCRGRRGPAPRERGRPAPPGPAARRRRRTRSRPRSRAAWPVLASRGLPVPRLPAGPASVPPGRTRGPMPPGRRPRARAAGGTGAWRAEGPALCRASGFYAAGGPIACRDLGRGERCRAVAGLPDAGLAAARARIGCRARRATGTVAPLPGRRGCQGVYPGG